MADTGRQSPLAVNVLGSILQNTGLTINAVAQGYMGKSKSNENYLPGTLLTTTCLQFVTYAINAGYTRGQAKAVVPYGTTVYPGDLLVGCKYHILSLGSNTNLAPQIVEGRKYKIVELGTNEIPATDIVEGSFYQIKTVGTTDYTLIGAANNNVDTSFYATGVATGTGTVSLATDFTAIGSPDNDVDTEFFATGPGTGTGLVSYVINANGLIIGNLYQIDSPGDTDFTKVGAENNDAGTIFRASGVGTGSGTVFYATDFSLVGAKKTAAEDLLIGQEYIITFKGDTNFGDAGAGSSDVGTIFVATDNASGTGLAVPTYFIATGTTTGTGTTESISTLPTDIYNQLISIGSGTVPALGNSPAPTYVAIDPAGVWARTSLESTVPCVAEKYGIQQGVEPSLPGPATTGYGVTSNVGAGQEASWYPYTGDSSLNPNTGITQWGFVRLFALQAWNEFNWNGSVPDSESPEYAEFLSSFMTTSGFIGDSNQSIHVIGNSETFLDGTYSNMNDLISAEISGISLAGIDFGTDLENLGKVIDLKKIETFGMPSNLLMAIGQAGAVTQDLGLALIAAGLTKEEISSLVSGILPNWSKELEQKILGAFLVITGENLAHILAPLQCKTQGLETLADLLDLKKMFPISYSTLTVPVYNGQLGLPTNSKTYYLIYDSGAVNYALNTQEIQDYVGTIIPGGIPPIYATTLSPENYVELPKGFGSYLDGIIPSDWATAAGAFSYSIRQINNINNLSFEVLAKVAKGIENVSDLPLVAGTSKPTDQAAIDKSAEICSVGSGQAGSYTMSDFFGCMSGLPYPWKLLNDRLTALDTTNLTDIYKNLLLTASWGQAEIEVEYTGSAGSYTVTGLKIIYPGGGYGRGGAPAPTITLSNGGTATLTIGQDPNDASTFGKVITATLNSAGPTATAIPTATVQAPPTSTLGGTNTSPGTVGWPAPMDAIVQDLIDAANAEIELIATNNPEAIQYINEYWNILGTQIIREQRARYTALTPVSVPKDFFNSSYPNSLYTFLDTIPTLAQDTRPHMSAQTIEAICDLNSLGGQSIVAKMREERNQQRLAQLGIEPDNNISNTMSDTDYKTVLANGTVPGAIDGITSPNGEEYTLPSWPTNVIDDVEVTPEPDGYYVPSDLVSIGPGDPVLSGFQETESTKEGDITPILQGDPNPVVYPVVPAGPAIINESLIDDIVIIAPPEEYNPSNLPPNLDPRYTSNSLLPATLSIKAAIDKVVECNCDCWVK